MHELQQQGETRQPILQMVRLGVMAVVTACLLCVMSAWGDANEQGNLTLVAKENQANRDAIRTWRGKVKITQSVTSTSHGHPVKRTTIRTVSYVYDRAANKYLFVVHQTEDKGENAGKDPKLPQQVQWEGIRTSEGFYRVHRWEGENAKGSGQKGREARPIMTIGPPAQEKKGDLSPDFDPFLYLCVQGLDVHEWLMFLAEKGKVKGGPDLTVSRTASRISVLLDSPKVSKNLYVFDLDQGGNPVQVDGEGAGVAVQRKRTFAKVAGIWVPTSSSTTNKNSRNGDVNEAHVEWIENVVNEPTPEGAFTLDKVGIQPGDRVNDSRNGIHFKYDPEKNLPELQPEKRPWTAIIIASVLAAAALLLLGGWWLRRKRRVKELPNAPVA